MNRSAAIAISITIALACIACSMLFIGPGERPAPEPEHETYAITYELNGGAATGDMPKTYYTGQDLVIPEPEKDDMVFRGWYLDEALTEPFTGVEELSGDIKLYAEWTDDIAGFSIAFSKEGYYDRGINSYDISGTLTCTYLYFDEDKGSYYIRNDDVSTYSYKYIEQTYTDTSSSLYWSSEVEREGTSGGQEVIDTVDGPKTCDITIFTYPNGSKETQWVEHDGWITYKIISEFHSRGLMAIDYYVVLTFTGTEIVPIENNEVKVLEGYGVTVEGNEGSYKLGSKATLKANTSDGIGFGGWYDENMELVSKDRTFTFTVVGEMTYYALNDRADDKEIESDTVIDLDDLFGVDGGSYTITNKDTGEVQTSEDGKHVFVDGGMYELYTERAGGGYNYFLVKASGDVERVFSWTYNKTNYSITLDIDYDDYLYAKELYPASYRVTDSSETHARDKSFVEKSYTDPVMSKYMDELVDKMISEFKKRTPNVTEAAFLDYLLKFTQYFEYQSDEEYMGTTEYWKFPLETLFEQGGDCEDTSILFCALAHQCREELNMKYSTAMLLLPGHMAGAVKLSGNTKWSYCETTTTGFAVGEIPQSMKAYVNDGRSCVVIEVA